jgi:signal transduction histidine kinase
LPTFFGDLKSQYEVPLGKEIELVWDCPPALPVLRTDQTKLTRILHNLIDNAIKFTDRGRVVVSARQSENQSLTFQVSDTGAGIPQGSLPAIFEMFRQLDSSKTREHEGVGLGLFVVKKLTDLLGGRIEVNSELGVGTTFTLTLPAGTDSGAVLDVYSARDA